MRLGMFADSDTAATVSSGGCRGYAVESIYIAAVAFSFTRHRGRATAAIVVSFGRGWSNVNVIYGMFRVE